MDEKYAQSRVAGTATRKLFHMPLNKLKYENTVSQFSWRWVPGIKVNPDTISDPLLVELTTVRRNGKIHAAARRMSSRYRMAFLM
jgi:hypothetical protein